jgi:hypothetical protein
LKPSSPSGIGRNAWKISGDVEAASDVSRVLEGDSPGRSGVSAERVRAAVVEALAAMSKGRIDLVKDGLEALLRAIDEQEQNR